jgi:hypothetical protein
MRPSLSLASHSKGSASCAGNWDWQWCTEMTQPFSSGLGGDMFFPPSAFNLSAASDGCLSAWGVRPRERWATLSFGSKVWHARFRTALWFIFDDSFRTCRLLPT